MAKKGTIVIICTQLEAGGAQNACIALSRQLDRAGYHAPVVFLYQKRDAFTNFANKQVLSTKANAGLLDYPGIFRQLLKLLRKEKPLAVITFTHYANVMGCTAAKVVGIPVRIASQRNPLSSYPKLAKWADPWLGQWNVYTHVTMVSNAVHESFKHLHSNYLKKCSTIYNGVLQQDFPGAPLHSPLRIGNVGRLSAQKNQELLLWLTAQVAGVELHIAGEGELRASLEQQINQLGIQDRVVLHGELSKPRLKEFYQSLDLFVFPSLFEGMSNALLEALSFGLPVMASNIAPNKEVLQPKQGEAIGKLLAPEDREAWKQQLENYLQHPEQLMDIRHKSWEHAKNFSFEAMAQQFIDLLDG